jgi:Lrp/AsnC family transcriptional regulator, leucine-responsive regulatory protein
MDRIDHALLEALQADARASLAELGKIIGLSISATNERVKKLVASGAIRGWSVRLDARKLGYPVLAFVNVLIDRPENESGFLDAIGNIDAVQECHHVTGEWNYMLKVRARDPEDLETLIGQRIKSIRGVMRSYAMIALSTAKDREYVPCARPSAAAAE